MGPLFFQVFGSGDVEAFDVRDTRYLDARLRRIWPAGESFVWTPTGGLTGHELEPYADAIYDELSRLFPDA